MGIDVAYGDSRTYFQTRQGHLGQLDSQLQPPYWPGAYSNIANQLSLGNYQSMLSGLPYQNAAGLITTQPPEPKPSTRVITDMGFGGGEAKPRSRQYAKCSGNEKRTEQPLAPD